MNEAQRIRTEKLRWHSRRALLELDLVLQRFWQRQTGMLDVPQAEKLERLLAMEDHDLWEMLSGRRDADDAAMQELVELLRQPGQ
jgi:succinate dehydrogenase flavin-adding protein (antitoxin of CptAB toxin-antitoxin module)